MKIKVVTDENGFLIGYAQIGGDPDWLEIEITNEMFEDLKENYNSYYIDNKELIKQSEKPNSFSLWDSKKNKWNYDKQLEISFVNAEILWTETELNTLYDTLDKAVGKKLKVLKSDTQSKIVILDKEIDDLNIKLEELEG